MNKKIETALESIVDAISTSLQEFRDVSSKYDIEELKQEATRQKILLEVLASYLKLINDVAIAHKTDAAEKTIIEDLYDKVDGTLSKRVHVLSKCCCCEQKTNNRVENLHAPEPCPNRTKRIFTYESSCSKKTGRI